MVWVRSDQRSIRSGRSDHSLFSLDHGLGGWRLALPRGNNKAAFRSKNHLKSDDSDQKQGVQLIANAGSLKRKF